MFRESLAIGLKGGPGSGFSDPRCRRGIPGQRGGSVNICEPGGMARAIALGVDVSDVDLDMEQLTHEYSGEPKVKLGRQLNQVISERIDEPNKVTRRQVISQQLSLPVTPYQRDNEYRKWLTSPRYAPSMWDAASRIEGIGPNDMHSFRRPYPSPRGEAYDGDIDDLARSIAADVELSRQLWPEEGQQLWRGYKVGRDQEDDWRRAFDFIENNASPDDLLVLPNSFLESWTTDPDEAAKFAGDFGQDVVFPGIVVEQHIPRKNVFLSGDAVPLLADATEKEVVVVSHSPFDAIPVKNIRWH